MSKIKIFPDAESLISGAADFIAETAIRALAERGRFTLALSGGNTPKPVYARLATAAYRDRLDWNKIEIFFGDERCVPPDDPQSNYLMVRKTLLDQVPIPAGKDLPDAGRRRAGTGCRGLCRRSAAPFWR